MRACAIHIIACIVAACAPFFVPDHSTLHENENFPGFPRVFQQMPLKSAPVSERESRFGAAFPGRIGKFSAGRHTVLIRWVTKETRMLHPASDCYRGSGYRITHLPPRKDSRGLLWGVFKATRGPERVIVKERIADGHGRHWTDVSAWYWAALLGQTDGPWWAYTVVEPIPGVSRLTWNTD